MNIEINDIHLEKTLSFFYDMFYPNFLKKKYLKTNENFLKFQRKLNSTKHIVFSTNICEIYRKTFSLMSRNKSYHFFYWYKNNLSKKTSNIKSVKNCSGNLIVTSFFSVKRRKRRKFLTEDERRIARILKNRRTAEESRQRRIQRMKQLENFVILSEEKEKKMKKEIYYLGKANATYMVNFFLT